MKKDFKNLNDLNIRSIENANSAFFIFLVIIFSIISCTEDPQIRPKLDTLKTIDTDIATTSALLKGEILILGNMNIIEYGIEISKNVLFSPSQTKGFITPPSTGVFQVEFIDLDPGTLYYYKAYVLINTAQVYSQNYENFTTK